MHKVKYNGLMVRFTITPRSPLLIKAGGLSPDPSLPDMQFVRTHHATKGDTIYIPGTSLKGVVRGYVESVLRTLRGEEGACNPLEKGRRCSDRLKPRGGSEAPASHEIYRRSCRACQIFGSTLLRGRIRFFDAYPDGEPATETRYGVAISRLSQAVAVGPFQTEVVVSASFKGQMAMENFEIIHLGLLAAAFKAMDAGSIRVGFGKNRGYGEVSIQVERADFTFARPPPLKEVWGVGMLATPEERKLYGLPEEDLLQVEAEPQEREELLFERRSYNGDGWTSITKAALAKTREMLE